MYGDMYGGEHYLVQEAPWLAVAGGAFVVASLTALAVAVLRRRR